MVLSWQKKPYRRHLERHVGVSACLSQWLEALLAFVGKSIDAKTRTDLPNGALSPTKCSVGPHWRTLNLCPLPPSTSSWALGRKQALDNSFHSQASNFHPRSPFFHWSLIELSFYVSLRLLATKAFTEQGSFLSPWVTVPFRFAKSTTWHAIWHVLRQER